MGRWGFGAAGQLLSTFDLGLLGKLSLLQIFDLR